MVTNEDRDALNDLFLSTDENPEYDSPDDILETPTLVIDIDEVEGQAKAKAEQITERLSNYFFDEKYIKEHPYIPNKIGQEMDNIRRLIKMLYVNEKAQDALIQNITMNAGKGTLYQSLTSLQNSMLNIQKQLNELVEDLEDIFKEMQANAEATFSEKPKETNLNDGSVVVRGSKEFIKSLSGIDMSKYNVQHIDNSTVDTDTGEVLAEDLIDNEIAI